MKKDEIKNLKELREKLNITKKKYTKDALIEQLLDEGGFKFCILCNNVYQDKYCCSNCGFSGKFGNEITIRNFKSGETLDYEIK